MKIILTDYLVYSVAKIFSQSNPSFLHVLYIAEVLYKPSNVLRLAERRGGVLNCPYPCFGVQKSTAHG